MSDGRSQQTIHPLPKSQRRPPASEEALRGDSTKLFPYPGDGGDSPEEDEEAGEDPLEGLQDELGLKGEVEEEIDIKPEPETVSV